MESLAVLILTHNEERNIGKCLESIIPLTRRIFVIDSGSDDKTVDIATSYGAVVQFRKWTNHADQFNWGLDHFEINSEWIMRMDADEEITADLIQALRAFLFSPDPDVTGLYVRRRMYFMGRWIRHGGLYPTWLLRVFRRGAGRCETRLMDEHIVVSHGRTLQLRADIIDKNNKDLTFWTDKHNRYASREIEDILQSEEREASSHQMRASLTHNQAQARRWMKTHFYARVPLFVRPFLYFLYRYFLRMGFLDGKEGLIFHFLQGFWYRFLVDAKLYEHQLQQRGDKT